MMNRLHDKLRELYQQRTLPNRSTIWQTIDLDVDEINKRFLRVGGEATCICGKLNREHPYSDKVYELTGEYLVELCHGKLGHL